MKTVLRAILTLSFFFTLNLCFPSTAGADGVAINSANFPDTTFRSYILQSFDTDGDEVLSRNEIAAVQRIDCTDMSVSSAKGIEFFTELEGIYFMNNQLTALNTSLMPNLIELSCGGNQIEQLDLSNNTKLRFLYCWGNRLTSLDLSNNPEIVLLYVSDNQLSSLDVSKQKKLRTLGCENNQLTSLDLSHNTELVGFNSGVNHLTSIILGENSNLVNFGVRTNELTSLDISGLPNLEVLGCAENKLTRIDLSHNPKLYRVHLWSNQLTDLDISNQENLVYLQLQDNCLSSLNIGSCPELVDLAINGTRQESSSSAGKHYFHYANGKQIEQDDMAYSLEYDCDVTLHPTPDFILPQALTSIEEEAFAGGAFSFAKLSENTASIGRNAFADCPNLTCVYIPEATTDIDPYAFDYRSSLIVYGKAGTAAETYANAHGFLFGAIS